MLSVIEQSSSVALVKLRLQVMDLLGDFKHSAC